jgi:hypothetical protein
MHENEPYVQIKLALLVEILKQEYQTRRSERYSYWIKRSTPTPPRILYSKTGTIREQWLGTVHHMCSSYEYNHVINNQIMCACKETNPN